MKNTPHKVIIAIIVGLLSVQTFFPSLSSLLLPQIHAIDHTIEPLDETHNMSLLDKATQFLIKRVIGVPGDSFVRTQERLLIGAEDTDFDFSFMITVKDEAVEALPIRGYLKEDEYFVVGDALLTSSDSREFGIISSKTFYGVVTTFF